MLNTLFHIAIGVVIGWIFTFNQIRNGILWVYNKIKDAIKKKPKPTPPEEA